MMQLENSMLVRSIRQWEWDRYDDDPEDEDENEEVFEDDDIDEF